MRRKTEEGETWDVASYDELHPGRFLKNSHLENKPVTLTIRKMHAENMGKKRDGRDDIRGILSFVEIPEQYASQTTNEVLLKALFGEDPKALPGKRVTLGPAMVRGLGGKMVPGIRVVGSPDMEQESLLVEVTFAAKSQRPKEKHVLKRTRVTDNPVYATKPKFDEPAPPKPQAEEKPPGNIDAALRDIEAWGGTEEKLREALNKKRWTKDEKVRLGEALEGKSWRPEE